MHLIFLIKRIIIGCVLDREENEEAGVTFLLILTSTEMFSIALSTILLYIWMMFFVVLRHVTNTNHTSFFSFILDWPESVPNIKG